MTRVMIGVPTFRRNDQVIELLRGLAPQISELGARHEVSLVVVDNNPDASAVDVVTRAMAELEIEGRCVHEPRTGLAAVRNRVVAEAAGSRLLVFIDDDELPGPQWLRLLVDCWHQYQPWAVTGPVESIFDSAVDPWLIGSGLFDRVQCLTGTTRRSFATNNLLLDLDALREAGLSFDERFSLTGGEDSFLAHQIIAAGGRIVWCDDAVVTERVPAARATRSWVLRRCTRLGETWSRVRIVGAKPGRARSWTRVECVARAAWLAVRSIVTLAGAQMRGDRRGTGAAVTLLVGAMGLGRGALGRHYEEYRCG